MNSIFEHVKIPSLSSPYDMYWWDESRSQGMFFSLTANLTTREHKRCSLLPRLFTVPTTVDCKSWGVTLGIGQLGLVGNGLQSQGLNQKVLLKCVYWLTIGGNLCYHPTLCLSPSLYQGRLLVFQRGESSFSAHIVKFVHLFFGKDKIAAFIQWPPSFAVVKKMILCHPTEVSALNLLTLSVHWDPIRMYEKKMVQVDLG